MLQAAAIFKDGMILQRMSKIAVFGDTDCESVEVSWGDKSYIAKIEAGHFTAVIDTDDSRDVKTMIIRGKAGGDKTNEIEIANILLGEVWLDGGQSNMELELQNSLNGMAVVEAADFDDIRFYKVPKYPTVDEGLIECEKSTAWRPLKGMQCADMSAVAYYFATKMYKELNVPIGIIDCYQGGTSSTCWVSEEMLKDIPEVQGYLNEWEAEINSKSDEQYAKEMDEYNASLNRWQTTVDELKAKDPDISMVDINEIAGPYPWPLPRGKASAFRPYGLHKSMISRVAPYTVKGFLYYQAEEDCDRADYYCKLNSAVIKQWRKDFTLPDVDCEGADLNADGAVDIKPFFLVQLPMYISAGAEDDKKWCVLRQQQYQCSLINENVGIAVISDCGEYDNIHPLNKMTPGYRLAERVLADVYGNICGLHNLVGAEFIAEKNVCELTFENTYDELCYRESDGETLTALKENRTLPQGEIEDGTVYGFEISSDGENFYKPKISVAGDKLILTGRAEENITDVRYGWFNYGVVNVYSKAGVPLMPFWKKVE